MGYTFKHRKKIKIDNKGSALVTVIVAAIFLSAVVTILLFVTAKNYKARQSNYKTAQNFYEAEKTLDEFKTVLIDDCSKSCAKAYVEVLNDYMNLSSLDRQKKYYEEFILSSKEIWQERAKGASDLEAVKNSLNQELKNNVESVGNIEYNETEGFWIIHEIVVSCSTIEGYYARIKTDLKVEAPQIDWGDGTTNSEIREILVEEYVVYSDWQRD